MEGTTEPRSTDIIIPEEAGEAAHYDESKEESKAASEERKEPNEEEQVEAAEPSEEPDENEVGRKEIDKMIREDLDKAKKLLKDARRKIGKTDQLCLLLVGSDDLDKVTSKLERMFELVNTEGSQRQKREFNILMKVTFDSQMSCLNEISWIQADEGTDKWNCREEKKYWSWRRTIKKYLKYFPEEMTVKTLIEDYMEDSKDRENIKEKIEGCKGVEEALKKIDSIYDKQEEFRKEEERLKIHTICKERPSYGSYHERENAKTILDYVRKVEKYNKMRDEENQYHLGRRFQLKFLSKLSHKNGTEIVQSLAALKDPTMKTYKEGLKNIMKRFPSYLEEWLIPPKREEKEDEEDDEQGYQTDDETCSDDDEEEEDHHEFDNDYDF